MPSNSDLIKWAEQGRLHTKYTNCTQTAAGYTATGLSMTRYYSRLLLQEELEVFAIRVGQTIMISDNNERLNNKGYCYSGSPTASTQVQLT